MKNLTTPLKLMTTLADGKFHSGQALGEQLQLSRVAINNYINMLRGMGLSINGIPKKGYQLSTPLNLLSSEKLCAAINSPPIHVFPIIDSTNQYLLERVNQLENGEVCVSEYQHAGRGRRGKIWVSPFGQNLYFSLYWHFKHGYASISGLSLLVGLVVARVLRQCSQLPIKLKWPNDIYLNQKKLAGILVELNGQIHDSVHTVIGVGINIAMSTPMEYQESIGQNWTNLCDQCNDAPQIDRNELVIELTLALRHALKEFEVSGLEPFIDEWMSYDEFIDKPVKLIFKDKTVSGIYRGINYQGALLLEQLGKLMPYHTGDFSLRLDQ